MRIYKKDGRKKKMNKSRRIPKHKRRTSKEEDAGVQTSRKRFIDYDLTSLCAEDFHDMQQDMFTNLALSYDELEKLFEGPL